MICLALAKIENGGKPICTAQLLIKTCYLYSADGEVADPNLTIELCSPEVVEWSGTIFDDHDYQPISAFAGQKRAWLAEHENKQSQMQSFQKITVDEALARL